VVALVRVFRRRPGKGGHGRRDWRDVAGTLKGLCR
jgi:hypothetical protein